MILIKLRRAIMKETIIKYSCDYCKKEMKQWEYDISTKLTIRIDLPDRKDMNQLVGAEQFNVCDECSEKIGIIHKTISEIGHIYRRQDSVRDAIMSNFKKIVDIFIWKKEE
jgi:hypothetical protein